MAQANVQANGNVDTGSSQATSLLSTEGKTGIRSHGKRKLKLGPAFLSSWPLEISAAVLSIACVIGMVALLVALDGKPYVPWTVVGAAITPNSILSILSTFSKSALLLAVGEGLAQLKWNYYQQKSHRLLDLQVFDEASRGPFGALKLLWSINIGASLASMGALITVLALAVDPFTQQIISYPPKLSVLDNSTASVNAIQLQQLPHKFPGNDGTARELLQPTNPFRAAVDSAILSGSLKAQNPTSFDCPTGNCIWPSYSTLGVCSKCTDISQELLVKCEIAPPKFVEVNGGGKWKICAYEFPKLVVSGEDQPFMPEVAWGYDGSSIDSNPSIDFDTTFPVWSLENVTNPLVILDTFKVPTWVFDVSELAFEKLEATVKPEAQRCYLTWCEKTYSSTRCENGILHDNPTSSSDLVFSTDCHNVSYADPTSDPTCPGWSTDLPHPSSAELDWSNRGKSKNVYWVSIMASSIVQTAILFTFGFQNIGVDERFGYESTPAMTTVIYDNFWNAWDNIATSLTNRLREINSSHVITGKVQYPIAHVHVNYGWFVFPAAIAVLGAAFLTLSIVFSSARGGVIWKSSVLPLLLCGLKGYERHEQLNRLKDLEEEATEIQAWLEKHDEGGIGLRYTLLQSARDERDS